MLSSSQHVDSDEISDSRHTWQLILASCTRATHFDVQQWSSSSHYIEVLSLPMQVFQILVLRGRAGKKLTEERAASEKAFYKIRKTAFQHPRGKNIAPLFFVRAEKIAPLIFVLRERFPTFRKRRFKHPSFNPSEVLRDLHSQTHSQTCVLRNHGFWHFVWETHRIC